MNLFAELKRRKVFRVAVVYAATAFAVLQGADILLPNLGVPDWAMRFLVAVVLLGFPLALVLAWALEIKPDGSIQRTGAAAAPGETPALLGKRTLIVAGLLVAVGVGLSAGWLLRPGAPAPRAGSPSVEPELTVATSIAVLAFENMSPDPDNAFFADGIAEEILNLLADVQTLSVASRTSAFAFKGKDTPVPEIASSLGVRYVLEGSVRKAGDQVRVTAQLIDAETDRHLWSQTFDRTLDDIFAIQDEIAGAIGQALQVRLLGEAGQAIQSEQIDPETYARFLEARHKLRQRTGEAMREANQMLIEIVEAEPDFARAHVMLGEAYLLNRSLRIGSPLVPDSVAVSQARLHATMARELNPRLSGIDLILGSIASDIQNDLVAALEHYSRAIGLEPSEPRPYHWRGWLLCRAGLLARSLGDLRQAMKLDPENPNVRFAIADCLLSGDNPEPALTLARQGVALGNPGGIRLIAIAELALGNRQAAIKTIEGMVESASSTAESEFLQDVIRRLGPTPSAKSESSGAQPSEYDDIDLELLAEVNRYDDILQALARRDASLPGIPGLWSNRHVGMRRDPRFIPLMERSGAVELWREVGPPPDCRAEGDSFTCGHGHEPLEFNP